MPNYIYHLECEPDGCEVKAIFNGLPFFYANGLNAPVIISKPINSVLIGRGNQVKFIITPSNHVAIGSGEILFSVNIKIKLYTGEDVTGPENGDIIKMERIENLLLATLHFDNDYYDFSKRLLIAQQIDKIEVETYARKLKAVLGSGNKHIILEEFKEKLNDYAIVYGDSRQELYHGFNDYLTNNYLANKPILDFDDNEIVYDSWCDGRIWEISVGTERKEFMLSSADADGLEYATKIFVGKVGSVIKIVR